MQDELVKLVADKAGITEEQAGKAVAAAMDFLKERLPGPLGSQLEAALGGDMGGMADQASV